MYIDISTKKDKKVERTKDSGNGVGSDRLRLPLLSCSARIMFMLISSSAGTMHLTKQKTTFSVREGFSVQEWFSLIGFWMRMVWINISFYF